MADEQKLQELYVEFQLLTQHLKQLQQQHALLQQQMLEMASSIQSLDDMAKVKEQTEILVPLSSGVFARAKISDTGNLIVNVGANVAVSKTAGQARELMEKQLKESEQLSMKIATQIEKFSKKAVALQSQLKELLPKE
jgi:prefoldin alpha subunit